VLNEFIYGQRKVYLPNPKVIILYDSESYVYADMYQILIEYMRFNSNILKKFLKICRNFTKILLAYAKV
jgi:hypothetical protein